MDKVSIVIPSYGHAKHLAESIDSALSQDYEDVEVIVVDDGSTDGSLEIAKKYLDRITLITKTNGGTSSALNAGINIMTGQWFHWLSADDRIAPTFVSTMMHEIEAHSQIYTDKRNTIFYSKLLKINGDGIPLPHLVIDPTRTGTDDLNPLPFEFHACGFHTALLHKSIFDKCGLFDEAVGTHEDSLFLTNAVISFDIHLHYFNHAVSTSRVHGDSLSSQLTIDRVTNHQTIQNRFYDSLGDRKYHTLDRLQNHYRLSPYKLRLFYFVKNLMYAFLPPKTYAKIRAILHPTQDWTK